MAREHLLLVGWGRGGWNREKLRDIPIFFLKNYIYNTPDTHTTNRTKNTDFKKNVVNKFKMS